LPGDIYSIIAGRNYRRLLSRRLLDLRAPVCLSDVLFKDSSASGVQRYSNDAEPYSCSDVT
jgi:hypothetical protein